MKSKKTTFRSILCETCQYRQLEEELSCRSPMEVTVFRVIKGRRELFQVCLCPRCARLLDQRFIAFCDTCGQKLTWPGLHTD